jgi:hypothetical protein
VAAKLRLALILIASGVALVGVSAHARAPRDGDSPQVAGAALQVRAAGRVIVATGSKEPSSSLPVDGNYRVGDPTDGRQLRWSTGIPDGVANVFLVPIARDGRVIGFVRSDEFLAQPNSPNVTPADSFASMSIVNEVGTAVGHFVDGIPKLDSDG